MEPHTINYVLAITYALLGWVVRVTWYYFEYDSDTLPFSLHKWWDIYDKFIITGFVTCVALAFLSDIIWSVCDAWVMMDGTPFDERFNIAIGFLAIGILMFFEKKSKSKLNDNKDKDI